MTYPSVQSGTETERLKEILRQLTTAQIRFVIARNETKTDRDAAKIIGVSPNTVKNWPEKEIIDEAVRLMAFDGLVTALELRRRNLAKAMAIKAAGLESDNEKIKQDVATEIIEWEMGKATQKSEVSGPAGGAIPVELFDKALKKAYGSGT